MSLIHYSFPSISAPLLILLKSEITINLVPWSADTDNGIGFRYSNVARKSVTTTFNVGRLLIVLSGRGVARIYQRRGLRVEEGWISVLSREMLLK